MPLDNDEDSDVSGSRRPKKLVTEFTISHIVGDDKNGEGEEDLEEADLAVVKKCLGMAEEEDEFLSSHSPKRGSSKSSEESFSGLTFDLRQRVCLRIADHQIFTGIFLALTFYALFAPDFDKLLGDKSSRLFFLILNSLVCLMFMLEIVIQSLGKDNYFLRPYFWLDLVALISLLPDTYVVQLLMSNSNAFVAGRSSRLARIIRVASRSSKATRMQRLTRLTRVASLLPRLGKLLGHRVQEQEVEKVLNKKLHRIFRLFDDDMDGWVLKTKVTRFLDSMKGDIKRQSQRSMNLPRKFVSTSHNLGETSQQKDMFSKEVSQYQNPNRDSRRSFGSSATASSQNSAEIQASRFSSTSTGGSAKSEESGEVGRSSISSAGSMNAGTMKSGRLKSGRLRASKIDWGASDHPDEDEDTDLVDFDKFSTLLREDPVVGPRLQLAVDAQLRKGTNMKNITSRHSEYIAVRVALGVILLLALLGFVQPNTEDKTYQMGLESLAATMRLKFPDAAPGMLVPDSVVRQIEVWKRGNGQDNSAHNLLWLDVRHLVFCDSLSQGASNCTRPSTDVPMYWQGLRPSFSKLEDMFDETDHRIEDMERISIPDLSDEDLDEDTLNERTSAIAVIVDRSRSQSEAAISILTTLLVICVILAGIVLLTKDLTVMSVSLLKPLRELADDMESLAQLQLAGAEDGEVERVHDGTDEIRQIRRTFEKMKKAIKSWGKYVPWPVVQMLLRANVEAVLGVEEVEASVYFSDIAGFTTIVESLPPEKSLLLLNRYFNDMTKVIDDHGGVVIEFIGDAILCVYGTPLENAYHSSAAVKAALKMLGCLRRINQWSQAKLGEGMPEVHIRCGVHTGNVLVGNMGFQSRIKYGIVGEDAQIPSRLEEANKTYKSQCLISHYTFEKLLPDHFLTRPIDMVNLRHAPGAEPELIHEVIERERKGDRSNTLWPACDLHAEAMELFLKRDFQQAREMFEEVGEAVKAILNEDSDGPTELLISRCDSYIQDPPPPNWDGVWDRSGDDH